MELISALIALAVVAIIVVYYCSCRHAAAPAKTGVEGTTAWYPTTTLPVGPGPWSIRYAY